MTNRKKKIVFFPIMLLMLILLACLLVYFNSYENVYISEIGRGISEDDDYIEICNAGVMDINLAEFCLSEDDESLADYVLTSYGKLGASQSVRISPKKAGISIDGDGGNRIYLSTTWGKTVDEITVPNINKDSAVARLKERGDKWEGCAWTSDESKEGIIVPTKPVFSHKSGFYTAPIDFSMSSDEGNKIVYTLDGTLPTVENGIVYEGAIRLTDASSNPNNYSARTDMSALDYYIPEDPVDKANLITAVCIDELGNSSEPATGVYFVNSETHDFFEKYYNIPVLCINSDADKLFGYENGILVLGKLFDETYPNITREETNLPERKNEFIDYRVVANFSQRGPEWERDVSIELFEECALVLEQDVSAHRRGVFSSVGQAKGLGLKAKTYLGNDYINRDLFGDGAFPKKASLKRGTVLLFDCLIANLTSDRDVLPLNYYPVALFLQGEYWGTYVMMEKFDEDYFRNLYGIEKVTIFNNEEIEGDETMEEFESITSWATSHDLSVKENYDYLSSKLDIQSIIDTYSIMIYACCTDNEERYNVLAWKPEYDVNNKYADGRWHWSLYDVDSSMVDPKMDCINEAISDKRRAFFDHDLLKALLRNDEFKKQFAISFCDIMNFNFDKDNVFEQIVGLKETYFDDIYDLLERFNGTEFAEKNTNGGFDTLYWFWGNRSEYVQEHIAKGLSIENAVNVYVLSDNSEVSLDINTSSNVVVSTEPRELLYYPEYEISLSMSSANICEFDHWEIADGSGIRSIYEEVLFIKPTEKMCIKICTKE